MPKDGHNRHIGPNVKVLNYRETSGPRVQEWNFRIFEVPILMDDDDDDDDDDGDDDIHIFFPREREADLTCMDMIWIYHTTCSRLCVSPPSHFEVRNTFIEVSSDSDASDVEQKFYEGLLVATFSFL